jgi:hypothetical protein
MYFKKRVGKVYHILTDETDGSASCGARLGGYEIRCLAEGVTNPLLSEEMPKDARLCKHCEQQQDAPERR